MFKKFSLVLFTMCLALQADVAAMKRAAQGDVEGQPATKKSKNADSSQSHDHDFVEELDLDVVEELDLDFVEELDLDFVEELDHDFVDQVEAVQPNAKEHVDHTRSRETMVIYQGRSRFGHFEKINNKRIWKDRGNSSRGPRKFKDKKLEDALEAEYLRLHPEEQSLETDILIDCEIPEQSQDFVFDFGVPAEEKIQPHSVCGFVSKPVKIVAAVTIPLITAVALYCLVPDVALYVDTCVGSAFGFLKSLIPQGTPGITIEQVQQLIAQGNAELLAKLKELQELVSTITPCLNTTVTAPVVEQVYHVPTWATDKVLCAHKLFLNFVTWGGIDQC